MTHDVSFRGFEPPESIRKLIEDRIEWLSRETERLLGDGASLRVIVERNAAHTVSITLELPGKTAETKQARNDLEAAIKDAFVEIGYQLKEYKESARRERLWKRFAEREHAVSRAEQRTRGEFVELVSPHLERVTEFVRRVVRYSEATSDLAQGEVTAEDLVDSALVRAYREFASGSRARNVRSWLMRLALDQLRTELKRTHSERERTVSIEEDIPETPPAEWVTTLGEEILYFYQPDEDLKLEDVIPELEVPTPEQVTETREIRQCVSAALSSISDEWRRIFLLHYLVGLTAGQLARASGRTERDINDILEHAREYLREKLIHSGCSIRRGEGDPNLRREVSGH